MTATTLWNRPVPALALLSLLMAAAISTGCSSSGHPEFAPNGAHISEKSDAATVVAIEIRTLNKSDTPFPLTRVDYTVEIDGKPAIAGIRSAQCTAHSFSDQTFTLPAVVKGNANPSTYRINGTVTYVPANLIKRVLYDEGIHRPSESFTFEGAIDPEPAATPARPIPELTPPPPRPSSSEKKPEASKGEKPAETKPK